MTRELIKHILPRTDYGATVTAAGRLSLTVEYVENNIDTGAMEAIREAVLGFLWTGDQSGPGERDAA